MVMPANELAPTGRLRTITQTTDFAGTTGTGLIDLFTIANGAIYCEMFIGRLTQAITATGAVSFYHRFTPENLAAGITDLNTILVVTADPIDTIYTCTGDITVILAEEDNGLCLTPSFGTNHWILGPGIVHLHVTNVAGDVDGIIEHTLVYEPMNPLVTVVAA